MRIIGIEKAACTSCGICEQVCPTGLFTRSEDRATKHEDPNCWCIGCGHCVAACPAEAITYDAQERAPELSGKLPSFDDTARMLMGQRTVRKYEDREVPRPEIDKILEVARYASSGHNAQPCEYLAVTDRTIIRTMVDLTMKSMKSFRGLMRMRILLRPFLPASFYEILNDRGTALGIDDMARRQASGEDVIFFDAPVVLIAHVPDLGALSYVDPSIAMTKAMLAAQALGLGSCWMGFSMMSIAKNKRLLGELGVPKGRFLAAIATFGYPKEKYLRLPVRNPVKLTWL